MISGRRSFLKGLGLVGAVAAPAVVVPSPKACEFTYKGYRVRWTGWKDAPNQVFPHGQWVGWTAMQNQLVHYGCAVTVPQMRKAWMYPGYVLDVSFEDGEQLISAHCALQSEEGRKALIEDGRKLLIDMIDWEVQHPYNGTREGFQRLWDETACGGHYWGP